MNSDRESKRTPVRSQSPPGLHRYSPDRTGWAFEVLEVIRVGPAGRNCTCDKLDFVRVDTNDLQ
ncbi:hypothetical protein D8S78_05945 [Natrialba swarupiae]|nr:hypothetical protein [Natrialba swarupiae]